MSSGRLVLVGDSCLSIVFDEKIDPSVNARCIAIATTLNASAPKGLRDVVPTYNAVTVHFDPVQADRRDLETELGRLLVADAPVADMEGEPREIPVTYGGASGPDLGAVAKFAGCSEQEVIRLHTGTVYRVYMLGFLPGFPYMGSVDARIAMPRLDIPRARVAAGAVGIAGAQTGIYPNETPGGWRIIGRTEMKMFDPARKNPSLLTAGDRVTFVAV